jgi:nucleoside 2-deoxyribosyltransferase
MSILKNFRVYLSGAIEFGDGPNWRIEPKKNLTNRFGLHVFDPFDDPKQQWTSVLKKAREEADYKTIRKVAKNFVRKDLCLLDRSDFLIAYLPYAVPTTGSCHEIINSVNSKKPTLLVCNRPKEYLPFWYYGIVPHECMFGCWEDLYLYLEEVNDGKHKDNNRWHFIYGLV